MIMSGQFREGEGLDSIKWWVEFGVVTKTTFQVRRTQQKFEFSSEHDECGREAAGEWPGDGGGGDDG